MAAWRCRWYLGMIFTVLTYTIYTCLKIIWIIKQKTKCISRIAAMNSPGPYCVSVDYALFVGSSIIDQCWNWQGDFEIAGPLGFNNIVHVASHNRINMEYCYLSKLNQKLSMSKGEWWLQTPKMIVVGSLTDCDAVTDSFEIESVNGNMILVQSYECLMSTR